MDIAPGIFKGSLPSVFIKNIRLTDISGDATASKLRLEIIMSLQMQAQSQQTPCNLLLMLVDRESHMQTLKATDAVVRTQIKNPQQGSSYGVYKQLIPLDTRPESYSTTKVVNKKMATAIKNKTVVISANLPSLNMEYLACYAIVYATDPQVNNPIGVPSTSTTFALSAPCIETIFRNSKVPALSTVYRIKNAAHTYGSVGDVWAGPVHYNSAQGYMAGARHTSQTHPKLVVQPVSNQKISDLRFLKNNSIALNNFSATLRNASPKMVNETARVRDMLGTNYFSNFYFSRTKSNAVKIYFAFNVGSFAAEKLEFSGLFSNKAALVSTLEIKDVKIYRERVQKDTAGSKLTGNMSQYDNSQYRPAPTLVATISESSVGCFELMKNSMYIKDMIVTDADASAVTAGIYRYSVHIEYVDNSRRAVLDIIKELEALLSKFDIFVWNYSGGGSKGRDPQIYLEQNAKLIKSDPIWKTLIDYYLASLIFIFGQKALGANNSMIWRKNLITMVNPQSSSPYTVAKFREIVAEYLGALQALAGKPPVGGDSQPFTTDSKIYNSTIEKGLSRYVYEIPTKYVRSEGSRTGYDYLNNTGNSLPGTPTIISYAKYNNRIIEETTKYPVNNPDSGEVNRYGFLSPRQVVTPTHIISTLQNLNNPGAQSSRPALTNLSTADSANLLQAKRDPYSDGVHMLNDTNQEKLKILGLSGISISAGTTNGSQGATVETYTDSTDLLGSGSNFISEDISTDTTASGSAVMFTDRDRGLENNALNTQLVDTLINAAGANFVTNETLDLERMQTSLVYNQLVNLADPLAGGNSFSIAVNYKSVRRVEYLFSHQTTGIAGIKQMDWRLLTKDAYAAARAAKISLLCRIVETNTLNNQFKLEAYDGIFVIGGGLSAASMNKVGYKAAIKGVYDRIVQQRKSLLLNINREVMDISAEYITSPEMIYSSNVAAPGANGPPATNGSGMGGTY